MSSRARRLTAPPRRARAPAVVHLAQREQDHHGQADGRDHDLRQRHIRRLEDEEQHRQRHPEHAEHEGLLQRIGAATTRRRPTGPPPPAPRSGARSRLGALPRLACASRRARGSAGCAPWSGPGSARSATSTTPTSSALSPISENDSRTTIANAHEERAEAGQAHVVEPVVGVAHHAQPEHGDHLEQARRRSAGRPRPRPASSQAPAPSAARTAASRPATSARTRRPSRRTAGGESPRTAASGSC